MCGIGPTQSYLFNRDIFLNFFLSPFILGLSFVAWTKPEKEWFNALFSSSFTIDRNLCGEGWGELLSRICQ